MRGDIVFRVYGVHEGRPADVFFGAFRSRAEAEAEIVKLRAKTMHGANWAERYHDRGFVIREHVVTIDFEPPSLPKPRDKYTVTLTSQANEPGAWESAVVEIFRRDRARVGDRVATYLRNYPPGVSPFEPFRQGMRELALISPHYTKTAVLDLASGEIIAEESESTPGGGFCPVGFYVPDWWDVNDGSVIPGSESWSPDREWPTGDFGFVWGCHWGDDRSWKVQHLDLSRVREGVISRDDRFGYVALETGRYVSPCLAPPTDEARSRPPDFIRVSKYKCRVRVRFATELDFDLDTGAVDPEQLAGLVRQR